MVSPWGTTKPAGPLANPYQRSACVGPREADGSEGRGVAPPVADATATGSAAELVLPQAVTPPSRATATITDATFLAEVERSPLPVLLDLWAPWCGPYLAMAPAIDQLAAELAGRVRVAKLNVDENPLTAARFRVTGIPTLLVLDKGREIDRLVGLQRKREITERLDRLLGGA